jgi:hypothetical protein
MCTGGSFPGVKADHPPTSSADVKNAWSCTSTPPYVFMPWDLVKHRDNFTVPRLRVGRKVTSKEERERMNLVTESRKAELVIP